jgi:branched-chain amino acid transport system ATP-binding protein
MLKIIDIHTYYGESYVLQGVSLEVEKGKVVAILGRNGMGKTTLIRSIVGFTPPRSGKILFNGVDITHMPSFKTVRMSLALVPQGRRIFPSLSVLENLRIGVRGRRGGSWSEEKIFEFFPALERRSHHRGNELSGGEQQMLAIARALMTNPEILLMDEPTEGLAPLLIRSIGDSMIQLKEAGLSTLLVEQNFPFAIRCADFTHVLSKGTIVYSSTAQELCYNEDIKAQYLGI